MKAVIIGRPTISRSGLIHLLEYRFSFHVAEVFDRLGQAVSDWSLEDVNLFCVEAEEIVSAGRGIQPLVRLRRYAAVVVYGSRNPVPKQIASGLVALGIPGIIDTAPPVDEIEAQLRHLLPDALNRYARSDSWMVQDSRQGEASLSPREREVLRRISTGGTSKSIAYQLGLSQHTVEYYRKQLMKKTQAASIAELTKIAIRRGITFLWE